MQVCLQKGNVGGWMAANCYIPYTFILAVDGVFLDIYTFIVLGYKLHHFTNDRDRMSNGSRNTF